MFTYYKSLRQQAAIVPDIPIPMFIEGTSRSTADRI
jgi:hypothetical protein